MKKIFGHMTVFNLNKHRDEYPYYNNKDNKIKWIWHWHMPNWLNKHLEDICFDELSYIFIIN